MTPKTILGYNSADVEPKKGNLETHKHTIQKRQGPDFLAASGYSLV